MPKSILRISSPDGYKRPRPLSSHGPASDATTPGLAPSPLSLQGPSKTVTVEDPPSSTPPPSPSITRPMSPGTTVRFAKATIHRVEVGPGRRFTPVKRKSKSTLTYISPLDPGTQRGAPKTMLQSPTKLRRHQENQAAMGRYWLRTEEEEAQWRAEAEKRAEEEAERYRNEPASPPPSTSSGASVNGDLDGGGGLASKVKDVDKLSLLNKNGPALDKVEEEEAESEDGDEDAGARCDPEPEAESVPLKRAEREVETTEESVPESRGLIATTKPADLDSPVSTIPERSAARPSESKSFSQRLADKRKETEGRAARTTTVSTATSAYTRAASPSSSSGESSSSARSSSSLLAQQPPPPRSSTTNLNPVNTQPSTPTRIETAAPPATPAMPIIVPAPIRQQLTRSPSRRASRLLSRSSSRSPSNSSSSSRSSSCSSSRSFASSEKEKTTEKAEDTTSPPQEQHVGTYHQIQQQTHLARPPLPLSSSRSTMSLKASSSSGGSSAAEEPRSRLFVSRSVSHGNMNLSGSRSGLSEESSSWSSSGGSGVNHLHLSGRRGSRRYLDDHKEGITA